MLYNVVKRFSLISKVFLNFTMQYIIFFCREGILKIKMATVHEKLIKELCFICGCILRGTVYDVENKLLGLLPCFYAILVIAQ